MSALAIDRPGAFGRTGRGICEPHGEARRDPRATRSSCDSFGRAIANSARALMRDNPLARAAIIRALSVGRRPPSTSDWLIVPFYHEVPETDRAQFVRQLRYMRSLGEMIGVDDALDLLRRGAALNGRYFCLTFDDGLRSAYANAFPILAGLGIPAVFFVVPTWVDQGTLEMQRSPAAFAGWGGGPGRNPGEAARATDDRKFVSWEECRSMARAGMSIASHSLTHTRLSTLSDVEVWGELRASKASIDREIAAACPDFACPWGQPGDDYEPGRDPQFAREVGYRSFFTTIRGRAVAGTSPWAIPRVRLEPGWGLYQLRHAFSR